MSELKWALCDLDGNPKSYLTGRQVGATITIALCDQRTATVTVPLDDEAAAKATAFDSSLMAWLDGDIVFRGVVTLPRTEGGGTQGIGTMEINATDPSCHLEEAWVFGGNGGSMVGLTLSQMLFACVYAADHQMFMQTVPQSFDVNPRSIGVAIGSLPDGPTGTRYATDGQNIWELMQDIATFDSESELITGSGGGIEFELTPRDDIGPYMVTLNCFTPTQGTDKSDSVFFEYGLGRMNLADFAWEPGGGSICNNYILTGPASDTPVTIGGQDYQQSPMVVCRHEGSIAQYGVFSQFESDPDLPQTLLSVSTMMNKAAGVVSSRAFPIDFCEITPAVEQGGNVFAWSRKLDGTLSPLPGQGLGMPPRIGPHADYWLGDKVSILARIAPGLDVETTGRVTAITLNEVDAAGTVVSEVTTVPYAVGAAGVTTKLGLSYTRTGPHHSEPAVPHKPRRHVPVHPTHRPGNRMPGPSVPTHSGGHGAGSAQHPGSGHHRGSEPVTSQGSPGIRGTGQNKPKPKPSQRHHHHHG